MPLFFFFRICMQASLLGLIFCEQFQKNISLSQSAIFLVLRSEVKIFQLGNSNLDFDWNPALASPRFPLTKSLWNFPFYYALEQENTLCGEQVYHSYMIFQQDILIYQMHHCYLQFIKCKCSCQR